MAQARRYELRLFDRTLVEFSLADTLRSSTRLASELEPDTHQLMPRC